MSRFMSRPTMTWESEKSSKCNSRALYFDICNVGKSVQGSKKRVTWRISTEEGHEHEVSLTHSLYSGKKVLRVDGSTIYSAQSVKLGEWDYSFHVRGNHLLHCIIRTSTDPNDMYDLIVDGISFQRLKGPNQGNSSSSQSRNSVGRPTPYSEYAQKPPLRPTGRPSFEKPPPAGSWECPRCTLINTKPLGLICEACETPRHDSPKHIDTSSPNLSYGGPAIRRTSSNSSIGRTPRPTADKVKQKRFSSAKKAQNISNDDDLFDPFSTASVQNSRSPSAPAFDPFESSESAENKASSEGPSEFKPFGLENEIPANAFDVAPPAGNTPAPSVQDTADLTTALAGIDFATPVTPVATTSNEAARPEVHSPVAPVPKDGDLWSSDIVNLNLSDKPQRTTPTTPVVTMEHARKMNVNKSFTPAMSNPAPMQSPGMNQYATSPMQANQAFNPFPSSPMEVAPGQMYGTQPYSPMGMVPAPAYPQQQQQQQYRPQPLMNTNDPFAGLT